MVKKKKKQTRAGRENKREMVQKMLKGEAGARDGDGDDESEKGREVKGREGTQAEKKTGRWAIRVRSTFLCVIPGVLFGVETSGGAGGGIGRKTAFQ